MASLHYQRNLITLGQYIEPGRGTRAEATLLLVWCGLVAESVDPYAE
jgi:hypothetical protein